MQYILDFVRGGERLLNAIKCQLSLTGEEYQTTRVYKEFLTQAFYYMTDDHQLSLSQFARLPVIDPILQDIQALHTHDTTVLFQEFRSVITEFYLELCLNRNIPLRNNECILIKATSTSVVVEISPKY